MLETVNYYNFNKSNVFVLMLDASKAFDRVNYCKLFGELLKRDISPIVLRLLLYMYTSQTLSMRLDNLKFYVVCINGRRYVCRSEYYVVYDECDEPTSCLGQPISAYGGEVMYFVSFRFRGDLGFLNCDDMLHVCCE